MVAYIDACMGHCYNIDGPHPKLLRFFGSPIFPWSCGKWALPWRCVLPLNVVQAKRTALPCGFILLGSLVGRCLWRDSGLRHWIHGWNWRSWSVALDLYTGMHIFPSTTTPANRQQEGLLTVVVALGAYFLIQNYPSTAQFLTESERAFIHARLKSDNDATNDEPFTWPNVFSALRDPKCWLYGLAFHTLSLPLYTLSLFLPTIISALGYTAAQAQLLTIPPYAIATFLTIVVAVASERVRRRAPFILGSACTAIIGYIILFTAPTNALGVSYVGTIFAASGIYPATAIALSWPANNVSGQTKRATANALQISVGNLGAVLGTQLYRPNTSPRFYLGHGFAIGYLIGNICVVGTLCLILNRENRKRERVLADHSTNVMGQILSDEDIRWRFQT